MLEHEQEALLDLLRKSKWSDWCRKELSLELKAIQKTRNANSDRLVDALSRASNNAFSPELLWDYRAIVQVPSHTGNIIFALTKMSKDCDVNIGVLACIQRVLWVTLFAQIQLLKPAVQNSSHKSLSSAAIAEIAEKSGVEAATLAKQATAGRKIARLMSTFGVSAVLRMDRLSLDFLCTKLSEAHIEDAKSSLEGSEALKDMRRRDDKACEAIMMTLERLEEFGFDAETFITAETDLGGILKDGQIRSLRQLRDQSRASTRNRRWGVAGQLTNGGPWRACSGQVQQPEPPTETNPWQVAPNPCQQTNTISDLAQPLTVQGITGDTERGTHNNQCFGGTQEFHLSNSAEAQMRDWNTNALDPVNFELENFEMLRWNRAFQYFDTAETINHSS
ncbi:hypothetical protein WHR41_09474 [Cladosporium halotolerans]|uniref:Uncharacterized protein n=1 Tax=Cladosporium halotolerans TaxID=1052096 RepID=A0AB34KD06_9PEZI